MGGEDVCAGIHLQHHANHPLSSHSSSHTLLCAEICLFKGILEKQSFDALNYVLRPYLYCC